jgi:hypothetical protein
MSDWKALVGRVTLFPASPSPAPSALSLFQEIWGGDPDSFQRQTSALMPTIAQGRRHGMSATCSVHPTRIDLSLAPAPSTQLTAQASVSTIEDTAELQRQLLQIFKVIGKGTISSPMARIALYLHFSMISNDFAEANKILTSVIPKKYGLQVTNEEDLVFQINRPRLSKQVANTKLNILTKWSVDRIQVLQIFLPPPGMPMQPTTTGPQNIALFIAPTVVLDISTPAEEISSFNSTQQEGLLNDALAVTSELQSEIGLNIAGF